MMTAFVDFLTYIQENQPGKWSGYPFWSIATDETSNLDCLFLCVPGSHFWRYDLFYYGDEAETDPALQILLDLVASSTVYNVILEARTNFATWKEMIDT